MSFLYKKNTLVGLIFVALSFSATATEATVESVYPDYPAIKSGNQDPVIQKGEYLSKMGDCISCHTNVKSGTGVYAGGLPIETPFGTFYTPNITPDKKTGIGKWSEADFVRALKEGKNPKGQHYFPVFPYVNFSNISDEDAHALYVYFMSIPPVELENKPLPFPFNLPGVRTTLLGWNLLFFYPNEPLKEDKSQSAAWNRGRYIVDGLGHCTMCHTPLNAFGSPKSTYYLTGGFIDGFWAPNITKQGLADVSIEDIAKFFVDNRLLNDAGPVAGPMAEVNHNSMNYMTEADRIAIGTYLKTVKSVDPLEVIPSQEKPTTARGRQIYQSVCTICHQDGKMTAPLMGDGHAWMFRLRQSSLDGLYQHAIKGYNSMPIKGACVSCSDNDVIAAVDYILKRSLNRSQWIEAYALTKKTDKE